MNSFPTSATAMHSQTLKGLIKANNWMFEQISKSIPSSLSPIKEMNTGSDGTQIFADRIISVGTESSDVISNLILTTSFNIEQDKINVCLFREDDFTGVEIPQEHELTQKIERAFVEGGLITH